MRYFKKNVDEFDFETSDLLIVFDDEKKTSDIKRVTSVTADSVMAAGHYKVPLDDCEITTGLEGRNFFYRAPSKSIIETERLANLEMSMVLSQITAYNPPTPPASMDWTKGLLFGLVFIAFVILGVSGLPGVIEMDMKVYLKFYELKGYVESMYAMANYDDQYDNPLLEKIQGKMDEIIEEIEKISA